MPLEYNLSFLNEVHRPQRLVCVLAPEADAGHRRAVVGGTALGGAELPRAQGPGGCWADR